LEIEHSILKKRLLWLRVQDVCLWTQSCLLPLVAEFKKSFTCKRKSVFKVMDSEVGVIDGFYIYSSLS